MGRHHKDFPRGNGESGEVRKLKDTIKRLVSDKKKLLAELKTLRDAFDQTAVFINKKTDKLSVEEMVQGINEGKSLRQIEDVGNCEACGSANTKLLKVLSIRMRVCQEPKCKTRKKLKSEE